MSDKNRTLTLGRLGIFRWRQDEGQPGSAPSEIIWQGEPHEAQAITVDVSALFPAAQEKKVP